MRQGNIEQNRFGGAKKPVYVFLQLEDAAVVGANAFKNAVAVKEPVVKHGDFGVLFAAKFPVNVNFHDLNNRPTLR